MCSSSRCHGPGPSTGDRKIGNLSLHWRGMVWAVALPLDIRTLILHTKDQKGYFTQCQTFITSTSSTLLQITAVTRRGSLAWCSATMSGWIIHLWSILMVEVSLPCHHSVTDDMSPFRIKAPTALYLVHTVTGYNLIKKKQRRILFCTLWLMLCVFWKLHFTGNYKTHWLKIENQIKPVNREKKTIL